MLKLLTISATQVSPVFVVMVGARACAFPLHHVAETMRPLPIQHADVGQASGSGKNQNDWRLLYGGSRFARGGI